MNQLLDELLKGETCMVVYSDNQGALFLVKNQQVSQRTKHIDIRQHFVRDLQQQKKVVGEFVQSKDNMANKSMKNLPEKLFMQHVTKLKGHQRAAHGKLRIFLSQVTGKFFLSTS